MLESQVEELEANVTHWKTRAIAAEKAEKLTRSPPTPVKESVSIQHDSGMMSQDDTTRMLMTDGDHVLKQPQQLTPTRLASRQASQPTTTVNLESRILELVEANAKLLKELHDTKELLQDASRPFRAPSEATMELPPSLNLYQLSDQQTQAKESADVYHAHFQLLAQGEKARMSTYMASQSSSASLGEQLNALNKIDQKFVRDLYQRALNENLPLEDWLMFVRSEIELCLALNEGSKTPETMVRQMVSSTLATLRSEDFNVVSSTRRRRLGSMVTAPTSSSLM